MIAFNTPTGLALVLLAAAACGPSVSRAHEPARERPDTPSAGLSASPVGAGDASGAAAGGNTGAGSGTPAARGPAPSAAALAGSRCPPKNRRSRYGRLPLDAGNRILRAVKVGWSIDHLLEHADVPTTCTRREWSYIIGPPDGPLATYSFRIEDGVVAGIGVQSIGCVLNE